MTATLAFTLVAAPPLALALALALAPGRRLPLSQALHTEPRHGLIKSHVVGGALHKRQRGAACLQWFATVALGKSMTNGILQESPSDIL